MILIDANSVCHQAKHSMGNLSWNDKQVGVIFGFINQLLSLAKVFETNEFVFAWDSRKSLRTELFPDYKKQRRHEKTPDEQKLDTIAYAQFDDLRMVLLPELGFDNSYVVEGCEADDIIASITFTNPDKEFDIISTDEDLYQLLTDKVRIYSIRKKKSYTNKNLWKDYGVTPEEWAEVKAIAGCATDGIPGVEGVGEVTACKYINRHLNVTHKAYRNIRESKDLIERNRTLVTLPIVSTPEIRLKSKDKLSLKKFQDICGRYGFQSFLERDRFKQWKEHVFNG